MNTTDPGSNINITSHAENGTLSGLATTTISASVSQPPSNSSDVHDPEFTIMVVLGLSLLLAGLAIFMAVWRRSEQDGDFEANCGPGESLTRQRSSSSEPQLKVWKRLGSYRRSYNLSFRRPPHRTPQQHDRRHTPQPPPTQTSQLESSVDPHLTKPCLYDYITEV